MGLYNYRSKNFGSEKNLDPENVWSKKIKACKNFGPESFVKIGLVAAEIFLIWTGVVRTNVAWTNSTVTVGI